MKKIILFIMLFVISIYLYNMKSYDVYDDAIRFRVISNSNSIEDINMKKNVVNEVSDILFVSGDRNQIKDSVINNIPLIESKIENLFVNNNYNKTYNVVYGMNYFPEKEYNNIIFSSGNYESLVIEIGEAKGDNYWCFLYPSLCVADESLDENNVVYESKIINFIRDLFM